MKSDSYWLRAMTCLPSTYELPPSRALHPEGKGTVRISPQRQTTTGVRRESQYGYVW